MSNGPSNSFFGGNKDLQILCKLGVLNEEGKLIRYQDNVIISGAYEKVMKEMDVKIRKQSSASDEFNDTDADIDSGETPNSGIFSGVSSFFSTRLKSGDGNQKGAEVLQQMKPFV